MKDNIITVQNPSLNIPPLSIRKNTSDIDVFKQVFERKEYRYLIEYAAKHHAPFLRKKHLTIIDCGSNIGLATVFFISELKKHHLQIFCIEADADNYKANLKNTQDYPFVTVINKALWNSNEALVVHNDFRDSQHWSRRVKTAAEHSTLNDFKVVQGITFRELKEKYSIEGIDILKIDVEGAESNLFSDDSIDEVLESVESIAIEIHDEFDCRQMVCDKLSKNGFKWTQAGEITIGIKVDKTNLAR